MSDNIAAKVIALHWHDGERAIPEATLEVEHDNGDRQLFVIQVLRMTDRISGNLKPPRKRKVSR